VEADDQLLMMVLLIRAAAVLAAVRAVEEAGCVVDGGGDRFCLPAVIGVGSVNAGTTSLARYLNAHPLLSYGLRKEHRFFRARGLFDTREDTARAARLEREWGGRVPDGHVVVEYFDGTSALANATWSTGTAGEGVAPGPETPWARQGGAGTAWEYYAREFAAPAGVVTFDFDPVYLAHGMLSRATLGAMVRLYAAAGTPFPKLVALLRDPAHQHCVRVSGRVDDAAACAAALSERRWADADAACPQPVRAHFHNYCYVEHVAEWRETAGPGGYLLLKSEELRDPSTRTLVVGGVLHWLGLDPAALPETALDELHNRHPRDAADLAICVSIHRRPRTFLTDCNAALADHEADPRWLWWRDDTGDGGEL
jgi:hypothetical protein